jgi:hypothetical protein
MIDPITYIESGKLEEYVLGLGTPDLIQEVECMSRVFPEIKKEIAALQLSLEQNALESAVNPRAELKNKILNALDESSPSEKIIPVQPPASSSSSDTLIKWLLALLVLSSLFLSYLYFNKSIQFQKTLDDSKQKETASLTLTDSLTQMVSALQSELAIITNPSGVAIKMAGTSLYPSGVATIYWDKSKQTVYIHPGNLPQIPPNKQFQLWGIVDGKPISLGLINSSSISIQSMSSVANPSTFAVTLEPVGGSVNPTLDQMYVAGNVLTQ